MGKRFREGSQKSLRTRYLTVGQTARILGISPSTLRLWENIGLVSPARSSRRYRLYSPDLLEALKRIKYFRDVKKLSVPGIKEALGKDRPTPAGAEVARAGIPTVMMFVQFLRGISHNKIEDTAEEHLELAVQPFAHLAEKTADWIQQ